MLQKSNQIVSSEANRKKEQDKNGKDPEKGHRQKWSLFSFFL